MKKRRRTSRKKLYDLLQTMRKEKINRDHVIFNNYTINIYYDKEKDKFQYQGSQFKSGISVYSENLLKINEIYEEITNKCLKCSRLSVEIKTNCLKKIRNSKGLTVRELSEKTDISYQILSRIENKHRIKFEHDYIKKIAKALDVEPEKLFEKNNETVIDYLMERK